MDEILKQIKKFGKVIEALTELLLKIGTLIAIIQMLLSMFR